MTSPEQVAAEAIAVHVGDARAASIAREVVEALLEARYLIEPAATTDTQYGTQDAWAHPVYERLSNKEPLTHTRTIYFGPWRPVEEESNE